VSAALISAIGGHSANLRVSDRFRARNFEGARYRRSVFEKERASLARQGKWAWFLLVPVICVGSYCLCGIGVAASIPFAEQFGARANAYEARTQLATLAAAVEAHCDALPHVLPTSVGPVPEETGTLPRPFVPIGSFVDLGFAPGSVYFRYSIETVPGEVSRLIAEGDLDGDGIRSRFAVDCRSAPDGCECDDAPTIENELE
jgi:hypothetical protein